MGVVQLLLADPRVDPNLSTNSKEKNPAIGGPPVEVASYLGRLEIVKLLLRCPKTYLSFRDAFGRTLVDLAKADISEHDKKLEYLNIADSDGIIRERKREIVKAIQSRSELLRQGRTCPE